MAELRLLLRRERDLPERLAAAAVNARTRLCQEQDIRAIGERKKGKRRRDIEDRPRPLVVVGQEEGAFCRA
jgi:hypothetical protein